MKMDGKGPSRLATGVATIITVALLTTGILVAARFGDLSMRAGMGGMEMGGLSMGMDMRPVDTRGVRTQPLEARGGQRLAPTVVAGTKEFALSVERVRWTILPNITVGAYSYNGSVPGPELRVTEGDRIRVVVTNRLPEPTSIHWHGLEIDNGQDGAAGVTQEPIAAGQTYTYEFAARPAGTFFYHSHFAADRQQSIGLTAP
ncbi:MAG TPA: multicopper oxidase domain-containing protein, partial [Candidatus Saccharimonadales bacterium]|nr:multicopper oxidase domain-containing protein [Candidatus Saccharimonadales bacterium]